jgi:hypothetical protein
LGVAQGWYVVGPLALRAAALHLGKEKFLFVNGMIPQPPVPPLRDSTDGYSNLPLAEAKPQFLKRKFHSKWYKAERTEYAEEQKKRSKAAIEGAKKSPSQKP